MMPPIMIVVGSKEYIETDFHGVCVCVGMNVCGWTNSIIVCVKCYA